jgi:hypothetical protein
MDNGSRHPARASKAMLLAFPLQARGNYIASFGIHHDNAFMFFV